MGCQALQTASKVLSRIPWTEVGGCPTPWDAPLQQSRVLTSWPSSGASCCRTPPKVGGPSPTAVVGQAQDSKGEQEVGCNDAHHDPDAHLHAVRTPCSGEGDIVAASPQPPPPPQQPWWVTPPWPPLPRGLWGSCVAHEGGDAHPPRPGC